MKRLMQFSIIILQLLCLGTMFYLRFLEPDMTDIRFVMEYWDQYVMLVIFMFVGMIAYKRWVVE